jgi:hypothetical protein
MSNEKPDRLRLTLPPSLAVFLDEEQEALGLEDRQTTLLHLLRELYRRTWETSRKRKRRQRAGRGRPVAPSGPSPRAC